MKIDRATLENCLLDALADLLGRNQEEFVFAAPLAVKIRDYLRSKTGDPKLEFKGELFGPILKLSASLAQARLLRFRDFLEAFPELVRVFSTDSGDRVKVLATDLIERRERVRQHYKKILSEVLGESVAASSDGISIVQLAKALQKRDPDFDTGKIGYKSFADWLESHQELARLEGRTKGARVISASRNGNANPFDQRPTTYVLVDSANVLSCLHEIIGGKPQAGQMPDWAAFLRFIKNYAPTEQVEALYFLAITPDQVGSTEGFRSYLKAVGYKVVNLSTSEESRNLEEALINRAKATEMALSRTVAMLVGKAAHIIIVGQGQNLRPCLEMLANAEVKGSALALAGFSENLSPDFQLLIEGKRIHFIDLEKDAKIFKEPLRTTTLTAPDQFDPSHYLDL